jgi:hypothetical protein
MRVDQIIRTEFIEDSCVAVDHGSVAPVLQGFDFMIAKSASGMHLFLGVGYRRGPWVRSAEGRS